MRFLVVLLFLATSCSLYKNHYTDKANIKRNFNGMILENRKISAKESMNLLEKISNKCYSYQISVGSNSIVYPVFILDNDTILVYSISERLRPHIEELLKDTNKDIAMTLLLMNLDKIDIVPDSITYTITDTGVIVNTSGFEDLSFKRYVEMYKGNSQILLKTKPN